MKGSQLKKRRNEGKKLKQCKDTLKIKSLILKRIREPYSLFLFNIYKNMKKLLLLIVVVILSSCGSIDKQHFKAREFYMKNKNELAILCSSEYPVRPEYIKGDTIKTKEVIYLPAEQVECPDGTMKDCPPPKHTKEIQRITDTIKVPDLATEAKLRNEISELTSNNIFLSKDKERALKELKEAKEEFKQKEKEHKSELRKLNWIIGGLSLIIVFLSIVILKRR